MKLIIAGDFSLQDRTARCEWNDILKEKAFRSVQTIIKDYEWGVVNLESPITHCKKHILKDGPSIKNTPTAIDLIKYCGFNVVTLANNHLKDFGYQGVIDTISICKEKGLQSVGAGYNLIESRKPIILDSKDVRIGIINICEHESSIATNTDPGTAPFNISYLYYDIKELKDRVDKIIVIIHGGRERYQLPTPRMKQEYRLIIDFGADIVVNHHQHCISGYEIYKEKVIFYGLGNFFFDNPKYRHDNWNYGIMLGLEIFKDRVIFNVIPYEQCNSEAVINILDEVKIDKELKRLNAIISNDQRLEDAFKLVSNNTKQLSPFIPFSNRYTRWLYRKGMLPSCLSSNTLAIIENVISCESHRESLLVYLKKYLHNE